MLLDAFRDVTWVYVVGAFSLKYPDVLVCLRHLRRSDFPDGNWKNYKVPDCYLVWRIGRTFNGVKFDGDGQEGDYVVQFFSSIYAREDIVKQYLASSPSAKRRVETLVDVGENTVITGYGRVLYKPNSVLSRPSPGELGDCSFFSMVLKEDNAQYAAQYRHLEKSRSGCPW